MSAPRDEAPASSNRPARGRLGRTAVAPPEPASLEASEVLQGQAAAVLAALARMQLRLDVLAREQSELFAQVLARLDQLEASLGSGSTLAPAAEPAAEPAPISWPQSAPSEPPRSWS